MLQEFLDANLLSITDEVYFKKLKKCAEEIAKKLLKDKAKVLSYTLTSLDPEVSPANVDVIEVKKLITKNWGTFSTNSKDTPLTFIRAVMLEALEIVSDETSLAYMIWLTGYNIHKYFKLIGKEKELVTSFLLSLGKENEKRATERWSLPSESKLQKLSIGIKEVPGVLIDKETLQKRLEDASGPTNAQGIANYESPNPNWSNAGSPWSHQFAPKAAQAVADVVNKALKGQAKELSTNQTQIQEVVNKLLIQTQTEILERNSFLQMRTQLLWWKEACYSLTLDKSYRGLPNGLLQILLAFDYSYFIPIIYPRSIDYFLIETHRNLIGDESQKLKISEILKQIELSRIDLKLVLAEPTIEIGRISLYSFINGFVWNKYTAKQLNDLVGIPDTSIVTLSDFTLWLFHDLQSLKISTT